MSPIVNSAVGNHSKFWVSVSHAHYSLGDYKEAADAFRLGLGVEPRSSSLLSALANAEERQKESELSSDTQSTQSGPGSDGMAEMLRAMGGSGGGENPLSALANNPMMAQMAQQLAANGQMADLIQNPTVANLVGYLPSGQPFS